MGIKFHFIIISYRSLSDVSDLSHLLFTLGFELLIELLSGLVLDCSEHAGHKEGVLLYGADLDREEEIRRGPDLGALVALKGDATNEMGDFTQGSYTIPQVSFFIKLYNRRIRRSDL